MDLRRLRGLRLLAACCWAACAATRASGLGISPSHVPSGREVEVTVSEVSLWSTNTTYSLRVVVWPGASTPNSSGTPKVCSMHTDAQSLVCPIEVFAVGDVLVALTSSDAGGGDRHIAVLHAYEEPTVLSVTVAQGSLLEDTLLKDARLSIAGGDLVHLALQDTFTGQASAVLRFVENASGAFAGECDMELDPTGRTLQARSPRFATALVNTTVKAFLGLNGHDFVDTGFVLSLRRVEKLKIGFLYHTSRWDFGWTFQHNVARLYLESKFFGRIETIYRNFVSGWGGNMCDFCAEETGWNASKAGWNDEPESFVSTHETAVIARKWIEEEGVGMIFGTSFYYQWDLYHMALRYPSVSFVHTTGWMTNTNMAQVFPKVYQARYLSGIVMAWYLRVNNLPKRVGYVSSYPLGETVRAINAFKLGLEKVDPEIEVYLIWLYTWGDARRERLGVTRLIEFYGVEGVTQHTDSREPSLVAQEYGKVAVGYNADMQLTVGDAVLTSPVLVWGEDYSYLVQKALDGEPLLNANIRHGGETGSWRLSEFSSKVPSEARAMVQEEQAKLLQGQDEIFCRPGLRDNKGRLRNGPSNPAVNPVPWEQDHLIPGTTCLTQPVIDQVCQEYDGFACVDHWLLEGVHDSCEPSPSNPGGVQSEALSAGECFLGGLEIPEVCPSGTHLVARGCVPVSPGQYSQDEKEVACRPGYAAAHTGSSSCDPCVAGTAANASGALACDLCLPGSYVDRWGETACRSCEPGRSARVVGATTCEFCPAGSFSSALGALECTPCAPGMVTLRMAATNSTSCVCEAGSYMAADSGNRCLRCPEGMSCAPASDLRHFLDDVAGSYAAAEGGPQTDPSVAAAAAGPFPVLLPGFWSSQEAPTSVFLCPNQDVCPGGRPGSCASPSGAQGGFLCMSCLCGYYLSSSGECLECQWHHAVLTVLRLLLALGVLVALVRASAVRLTTQRPHLTTLFMVIGQLVTFVQVAVALHAVGLHWGRPFERLMERLTLFNFNFEVFQLNCVSLYSDLQIYGVQMATPLLAVAFIGCCFLVSHFLKPGCLKFDSLVNSIGQLGTMLYISLTLIALVPFHCYEHPNNTASVVTFPQTLCGDGVYSTMLVAACIGIALYPTLTISVVFYAIVQYPQVIMSANISFIWRFRFVFFRWSPERYWFGAVVIVRNLLLSVFPMTISVRHVDLTVLLMQLALATGLLGTAVYWPWRTNLMNQLDLALNSLLCFVLCLGSMTVFGQELSSQISTFLVAMVVAACGAATTLIIFRAVMILRSQPNYAVFLSHHKGAGACTARFIKYMLQKEFGFPVFYDCDDLTSFTGIFDAVKQSSNLLVILTGETLCRPWCVGEIVTAYECRIPMYSARISPHEGQDGIDKWVEASSSSKFGMLSDFEVLRPYGICCHDIPPALDALLRNDPIILDLNVGSHNMRDTFEVMVTHLRGLGMKRVSSKPGVLLRRSLSDLSAPKRLLRSQTPPRDALAGKEMGLLIMTQSNDVEAVSSAHLLRLMLQVRLQEEVGIDLDLSDEELVDILSGLALRVAISVITEHTLSSVCQLSRLALVFKYRPQPQIVPVIVGESFEFPTSSLYSDLEQEMSSISQELEIALACEGLRGADVANSLREIFKGIALFVNIAYADQTILNSSVGKVLKRVKALWLTTPECQLQVPETN